MKWYILECSRGQERQCAKVLGRFGLSQVWWPQKRIDTRAAAKKRREKGEPRHRLVPWIPGYLFVEADSIACHKVNGWHGQYWLRVLAFNGEPYTLTDGDMQQMRDMPHRLKQLVEDAAEQERREREARKPVVGEIAVIMAGPFAGQEGVCEGHKFGRPVIDLGGIIGKYTAAEGEAERVVT